MERQKWRGETQAQTQTQTQSQSQTQSQTQKKEKKRGSERERGSERVDTEYRPHGHRPLAGERKDFSLLAEREPYAVRACVFLNLSLRSGAFSFTIQTAVSSHLPSLEFLLLGPPDILRLPP